MKLAIAILFVLVTVGPAAAQGGDRKTAERYFRAGAKAYAAQNFAAAAANFDEAFKALPMPEIAFSAAQAYRRLYRVDPNPDHVQRAVALYRVYLDNVKTGGRVGDAADNLGEMQRELDRLGLREGPAKVDTRERTRLGVTITLADQTADTAVREIADATPRWSEAGFTPASEADALPKLTATIDGKPVEPFALVDVAPGEHVVRVDADGYFPVEKRPRAVAGASDLVDVELRPKPAIVQVKTLSGAKITVDGRTAPSHKLELSAGTHLIQVTHRGREPFARELEVARGQEVALTARLRMTGKRRAVPWVLGGAALLAIGAGATATLAIVHDGRADDHRMAIAAGNQAPSVADAYENDVRARDDYRTTAWILGGAAVVAGTTGALLYYLDTPGGGGVGIAGRF